MITQTGLQKIAQRAAASPIENADAFLRMCYAIRALPEAPATHHKEKS